MKQEEKRVIMTYEEIAKIFKEHAFHNLWDIEEYFKKFDFECEVDVCQWDDVSYNFTAPDTKASFYITVDPYMLSFNIYIFKNEDELYCSINYKVNIQKGKIEYEP